MDKCVKKEYRQAHRIDLIQSIPYIYKGKGKGKIHPSKGQEGPEGE